jgi:hypothetical protein
MSRGWSALEVLGEPGEHEDPLGWERESALRAIEAAGNGQVLVVGKSLASLLAGEIADRGLPAVWLTPLLNERPVIDGLARTQRPVLLASGGADPTWVTADLPDNPALEVLDLPGVDHGVQVPGDLAGSANALARLAEGVAQFVDKAAA